MTAYPWRTSVSSEVQAQQVVAPQITVLLTPEEAAQALRVGRSKVYELMRSGALRSVKIGGSRRISATALAEYVARLEQDAA
jgi:excisionase family DNA binding protein